MSDPIGVCPVTPTPVPPLRASAPVSDLVAQAAEVVQRREAQAQQDRRLAQSVSGSALPTLEMPAPVAPVSDLSPSEQVLKELERPDQGTFSAVRLDLGRPLVLRPDGVRLGMVAAGHGAIGPSNLPSSFVSARGHVALQARFPDPAGGFDRFLAFGPAVGIDGDTTGTALTIRRGGVGGHVETGIAIPLPVERAKVELGAYADVLNDRQEGGFLLRIQTGP